MYDYNPNAFTSELNTSSSLLTHFFRIYVVFIILFFNVQEFLLIKFDWLYFVSYLDELVALSAYFIAPLVLKKKRDLWVIALLAMPILSIIHGIFLDMFLWSGSRYVEIIIQSFINMKLFLYFVILYCYHEYFSSHRNSIVSHFGLLLTVSIIGVFINIMSPENFIYSTYEYALERKRLIGFQFKPNDLSILLSFAICLGLLIYYEKIQSRFLCFSKLSIFIFFTLILFSTARTALVLVFLLVFMVAFFSKNKIYTFIALCFIVILGALTSGYFSESYIVTETLKNFKEFEQIDTSQYIRFIMLYYSLVIGLNYFIGVGSGNFGSVMSKDSPAYIEYGLSKISFFEKMEGIYDSNIASIIGEYGYFGLVIYFVLLWMILKYIFHDTKYQLVFLVIAIVIALSQPLFNYHVNSVNFLLMLFSYKQLSTKMPVK